MNTITINDPANIIHMVVSVLNFAFTFIVMMVGFVYGMKKVAKFSSGAVICLAVSTAGGILFLTTGGGRQSGAITLSGRMDNVTPVHACTLPLILFDFESNEGDQGY